MAHTALVNPKNISDPSDRSKERFLNLVKQLPSEATAIYLAGMGFFAGDVLWLSISAAVGFIILIWVRARAKVTTTIWVMSIIGYVVWIFALGNGPLQAAFTAIGLSLPDTVEPFAVLVYTTIVTIVAVNPPKQG